MINDPGMRNQTISRECLAEGAPGGSLLLRNRQRTRRFDPKPFRNAALFLLQDLIGVSCFELGIYLVDAKEITWLNETFLDHAGSTDVITFDYSEELKTNGLRGEIFICIAEAIRQAREFRTTWQSEILRYIIHGILHLQGYDDLDPAKRRKMKAEEERLLRTVVAKFTAGIKPQAPTSRLRRTSKHRPPTQA